MNMKYQKVGEKDEIRFLKIFGSPLGPMWVYAAIESVGLFFTAHDHLLTMIAQCCKRISQWPCGVVGRRRRLVSFLRRTCTRGRALVEWDERQCRRRRRNSIGTAKQNKEL